MINRPDDVTVCEGRTTTFTCVLNSNTRYSGLQWYRFIKDTGAIEMVGQDDPFTVSTHTGNTINSSLTITDVRKSYTGYYWVGTPYFNVCNVSLSVATSMWSNSLHIAKLYVHTVLNTNIRTSDEFGSPWIHY